jgi:hypothetical protein
MVRRGTGWPNVVAPLPSQHIRLGLVLLNFFKLSLQLCIVVLSERLSGAVAERAGLLGVIQLHSLMDASP